MDNVLCRSCRVRRSIKQVARARGNSMKRTSDRCLFPVDRTTRGNSKNEERQRADALVTIMKTTGSRGINCESRPRGRKKGSAVKTAADDDDYGDDDDDPSD